MQIPDPDPTATLTQEALPEMLGQSLLLSPVVLSGPLFSAAHAPKTPDRRVKFRWVSAGRGEVTYEGPLLTQSHATALFALLQAGAGQPYRKPILISPTGLLRQMGWSSNTRNRLRLVTLLDDLAAGHARVNHFGNPGTVTSGAFIAIWTPSDTPGVPWAVQLGEPVMQLFGYRYLTWLDLGARSKLHDGLATWLYGYLCANTCKYSPSYAELQAACGSRIAEPTQFARELRRPLAKMVDMGVLRDFTVAKGLVTLDKVRRPYRPH